MTAEDRAAHVEREAVAAEVRAMADRARQGSHFYRHVAGARLAFASLADDLDLLAERMPAVLAALPQTGDAAAVAAVGASPEARHAAHAALLMARAHEPHRPSQQDRALFRCKGISDPLSDEWCQFRGTAKEQFEHQQERVAVALNQYLTAGADQ